MKRTIIIVGAVALLIFLIVRMIVINVRRDNDAQREFVSKLGYELSARVDSVGLFNEHAPAGFLYVTITRGAYENNEKKISRGVTKRGRFRFLAPFKDQVEIFSEVAREHQPGDSLVINTGADKIVTYRDGKQIIEAAITENLIGGNR